MEQINHKLVMAECAKLLQTHGVNIKGKGYTMVKDRIELFRKHYGLNLGIKTDIFKYTDEVVVVVASIVDANDRVIGKGSCEEFRNSSKINQSSALMNCETGAIGRALGSCGLAGTEFASAEEMVAALTKQESKVVAKLIKEKEKVSTTKRDEHPLDDISFHPRENWEAWRDINMQTLGKYKFVAEFQKWIAANNEYLVEYAKTDNDSYQVLKQFINIKMKGCAE
jgi:hypothetical protein